MENKKLFLTPTGLGVLCGVTTKTIIESCKRGQIKSHRTPGGHYRIPKKVAEEFLKKLGYK